MKKSNNILLGAIFTLSVASCSESKQDDWITGFDDKSSKDTVQNGNRYRYYGGGWYPIRNGMICPTYYSRPYSAAEIGNSSFTPSIPPSSFSSAHGVTTGGFGSSAHASVGE